MSRSKGKAWAARGEYEKYRCQCPSVFVYPDGERVKCPNCYSQPGRSGCFNQWHADADHFKHVVPGKKLVCCGARNNYADHWCMKFWEKTWNRKVEEGILEPAPLGASASSNDSHEPKKVVVSGGSGATTSISQNTSAVRPKPPPPSPNYATNDKIAALTEKIAALNEKFEKFDEVNHSVNLKLDECMQDIDELKGDIAELKVGLRKKSGSFSLDWENLPEKSEPGMLANGENSDSV